MDDSKIKLFVVDDNKIFRKAVCDFLENKIKYTIVDEASDGEECIEKFENLDIDIILMDINMPKMNGIHAAKIINQRNPNKPKIIALTQYDEFEYTKSMVEAGAIGYVLKSEVGKQLVTAIKKAMKGEYYFPK